MKTYLGRGNWSKAFEAQDQHVHRAMETQCVGRSVRGT